MNFRPEWLKNKETGMNFELDVYIPQLRIALEYDGYNIVHAEKTYNENIKYDLIYNSDYIDKIIVIYEDGCVKHECNDKLVEYSIENTCDYNNYVVYLKSIIHVITKILVDSGVEDAKLSNKISLKNIIKDYDETKVYSYNDVKTNVIELITKLEANVSN